MRYVSIDKSHTKKSIGMNRHTEYSRCENIGKDTRYYAKAKEWFNRKPYSCGVSNE